MSRASDTETLLCDAAAGNPRAKEQLLSRHRDQLKRMVAVRMHPRLASRFDPSDVVQEALVVATQRFPTYLQERPLAFYPWLRQLTYERLIELHRRHFERRKRSVQREAPQRLPLPEPSRAALANRLIDSRSGPGTELVRGELRSRVRSALDNLPDIYREVLVLRHLEQLSNEETARALGIGSATVKTRYYRAIQRMHAALSESDSDSSPPIR